MMKPLMRNPGGSDRWSCYIPNSPDTYLHFVVHLADDGSRTAVGMGYRSFEEVQALFRTKYPPMSISKERAQNCLSIFLDVVDQAFHALEFPPGVAVAPISMPLDMAA